MSFLLNILWFIFGGFLVSFAYIFGGLLLCITIIGIPFGIQCFKLAILGLAPLALMHLFLAAFFAITIIGLPFAVQHLKMTRLAILPFGFRVVESR